MKYFNAHWGIPVIVVSTVLTILCLGLACESVIQHQVLFGLLLLTLPAGCAVFTVRGYTVTRDAILIHRLFWATQVPLAGLQSAQFQPSAMRWSIRFGNGGFFSVTGFYWSKILGFYRAFVTDTRKTVVLRYARRTIVVSPSSPEEFVHELAGGH